MEFSEIVVGVIFTAIAVVIALQVYPIVHNAIDVNTCAVKNGSGVCGIGATWNNQTSYTGIEVAMLNLISLIFPAAIALTPVSLLYLMSRQ